MTDEQIVEAMGEALGMAMNDFTQRRLSIALAIAKPLIAAEAREAALKEAAETVWNAPLGVLAAYDAVRALYEKPQ